MHLVDVLIFTGSRHYVVAPDSDCGYMIREVEADDSNRYLSCAHVLERTAGGLVVVGTPCFPGQAAFGPEIERSHVPASTLAAIRNELTQRDHLEWLAVRG